MNESPALVFIPFTCGRHSRPAQQTETQCLSTRLSVLTTTPTGLRSPWSPLFPVRVICPFLVEVRCLARYTDRQMGKQTELCACKHATITVRLYHTKCTHLMSIHESLYSGLQNYSVSKHCLNCRKFGSSTVSSSSLNCPRTSEPYSALGLCGRAGTAGRDGFLPHEARTKFPLVPWLLATEVGTGRVHSTGQSGVACSGDEDTLTLRPHS